MKVFKTFTVTYRNKKYEIECFAYFCHDSNYGADIDGNRGIAVDYIDDIGVEDLGEAKKLPKKSQETIEERALEQANACDDWPSPDYDDYGRDEPDDPADYPPDEATLNAWFGGVDY